MMAGAHTGMNDTVGFHLLLPAQDAKSAMGDPIDMYIFHPLSLATVRGLGLKNIDFITPNLVSAMGLVTALACAVFIWHNKRWPAALLWLFAIYLDCLDGDLAREKRNLPGFSNDYNSVGYIVEVTKDIVCGIILHIAFFKHTITRNRSGQRSSLPLHNKQYEMTSSLQDTDEHCHGSNSPKPLPLSLCRLICSYEFRYYFVFAIQSLVRSGTWDRAVHSYHDLLETDDQLRNYGNCLGAGPRFAAIQTAVFNSGLSQGIFILWRFSSGTVYIHLTWLAYLSDWMNEYMNVCLRYGWAQLLALLLATIIHVLAVRTPLDAFAITSCLPDGGNGR